MTALVPHVAWFLQHRILRYNPAFEAHQRTGYIFRLQEARHMHRIEIDLLIRFQPRIPLLTGMVDL